MPPDTTKPLSEVADTLREIADDCAADAHRLDSTPFTPRGVGETFGSTLAMLAAVAKIAAALAERLAALEAAA